MSPQKKLLLRRNAFYRQQLAKSQLPQHEAQGQTADKTEPLQDNPVRK